MADSTPDLERPADDTDSGDTGDTGDTDSTESTESTDEDEDDLPALTTHRTCGLPFCSAAATSKCASCGAVWYCSREHQRSHWREHKADCRIGSLWKTRQAAMEGGAGGGASSSGAAGGGDNGGCGGTSGTPEEISQHLTGHSPSALLHRAAAAGDLDVARAQLGQPGVDVDAHDAGGATAMYIAAAHGHTAMVELLADEAGADVQKATRAGIESFSGPPPHGRLLVSDATRPLFAAAKNGKPDTARALIERGAEVNHAKLSGFTPLIGAAGEGHAGAVAVLLENGADANQSENNGVTPVFAASQEGHAAALAVLIENGAGVNLARNDGCTPVYIAAAKGYVEALALLLDNGGDLNQTNDSGGCGAVYIAAHSGLFDVLKLLIAHGGDVNQGYKSVTPVLIAAQEGHTEILKFVLANGGDVSVVRDDGSTAVFLAAARGKLGTSPQKGYISALLHSQQFSLFIQPCISYIHGCLDMPARVSYP